MKKLLLIVMFCMAPLTGMKQLDKILVKIKQYPRKTSYFNTLKIYHTTLQKHTWTKLELMGLGGGAAFIKIKKDKIKTEDACGRRLITTRAKDASTCSKVYGIRAEDFYPPLINQKAKVLDIGAGDGVITKKIIDMAGKDNVVALEPALKDYEKLVNLVGSSGNIKQKTLQEALYNEPETFKRKFDVVTIFKYNIPLLERDEFIKALSEVIKPEGTIFITSVERERFFETRDYEVLYLRPHLENYFKLTRFCEPNLKSH